MRPDGGLCKVEFIDVIQDYVECSDHCEGMNSRCYRSKWRILEVKLTRTSSKSGNSGPLDVPGHGYAVHAAESKDRLQPVFADLLGEGLGVLEPGHR